jgi:hypothetical protein
MPGTVRLVSATFVARITRRRTPATVEARTRGAARRRRADRRGEDLGGAGVLRVHAADGIHRVADLGLAGEEDEHVAVGLAVELAQRRHQRVDVVTVDSSRAAVGSFGSREVGGRERISTG